MAAVEAGSLFQARSAEEIRVLERAVRADIEQKKEELRQMVGERYRDLIEAADTIGDMRRSSGRVLEAVRNMERSCGALRAGSRGERGESPSQATAAAMPQEKFYSMAAQIKLLLEIPEKMWSAMEASQYLHATQLYLLCCHLHSLLQLDSSTSRYSPILARFPILVRQVAAAGTFRSTILQESKSLLRCPSASDQAVAEALCSIMLLEGSSPRQALADFLLARKTGIQQLLNQPHHGLGIKAQVCSLVELMANTLYQAHALFYTQPEEVLPGDDLPCGLLFSMLESVTAQQAGGKGLKVLKEEMKSVGWFKHLPPSIVAFQPALRTLAHPINQDHLRETLQQWISMCNDDIKSGISALLVYVKSLKGLAGIRDAVWELLTSESMSQNWNKICKRLLERPVRFWEDLLQQMFLDRLQTLTREGFESISSSSVQLLLASLQELEGNPETYKHIQHENNICSFLWCENPSDLAPDAAWVNVGSRVSHHSSGLYLKAQAVTPCIQSFCAALDSKLREKLEDLFTYLPRESPPATAKLSAFDRYGDASTVRDMLSYHCLSCMQYIQDSISDQLQAASHTRLGEDKVALFSPKLCAVLFLARLCQSLSELCPHLKQCIVGKPGSQEHSVRDSRTTKKTVKGKNADTPPTSCKWQELKDKLIKQSLDAYSIWNSAVVKYLVNSFSQTLLQNTAGSVLATATHWDEIEIQEETEAGSSVTSKIRLPSQCSCYVQSLLFNLCQAVNRVGGHALPKVTLQELMRRCLEEVIAAYEKLCQRSVGKMKSQKDGNPLTQSRALQLLFDMRYISLILSSRCEDVKKSKEGPRIQQVADQLESCIDPFDLDVFTPHLNANLNRLAHRTSVLFGLLTGAESQFTGRSSTLGLQETHNVFPLASSQIRFGLLPLSMSSSRKSKPLSRTTEDVKIKDVAIIPPPEEDPFRPGSLFRQLATQEEDTQAPSLFKLGWLSSMTK
ncbi:conserved oligomeric Golgi complex subunit 1 [Pelobates cultripes]|nr:conserved oligomeric Golgi complex subunit 1 [Pelobates cultripes]CAH2291436.1 conserved oligomeric Golgi complex subunit 1 [Pelobates cultripes]CAH2291437.1 conserved oligomeric Golgi complex subunit 1 [Pelobates cultripes]CAH2291441.1 conserved oligomeric Golgi complex subunit 1 [Pelobates cultripes]